jgi:hypothetical protein
MQGKAIGQWTGNESLQGDQGRKGRCWLITIQMWGPSALGDRDKRPAAHFTSSVPAVALTCGCPAWRPPALRAACVGSSGAPLSG